MERRFLPVLVWCFVLVLLAFEVQAKKKKEQDQIGIGRFRFDISDNKIDLDAIHQNETLLDNLTDLYIDTAVYWFSDPDYITVDEAYPEIEALAFKYLPSEQNYSQLLMINANNSWKNAIQNAQANRGNQTLDQWLANKEEDFTSCYLDEVYNLTQATFFYILGAYMGMGKSVDCSDFINTVLEDASEWKKAGSNAATTLMALLPTFLAFGNL